MKLKFFHTHLPLLLLSAHVNADTSFDVKNLMAMSLEELSRLRVSSIASGSESNVARAPGVTYVITEADMNASGAHTLTEALRGVPGLYVGLSDQGLTPIFQFRGITSPQNPQTLMLFNGLPLTSLASGNRGSAVRDWPTALIKRIEIIRGPGSALYGADAVAGVINIITKSFSEKEKSSAGVRVGGFNTKEAWLLSGTAQNDWKLSIGLDAGTTAGNNAVVDSDRQSALDAFTGTHASLAPGQLPAAYDWSEGRVELTKNNWLLRLGYEGRFNLQNGMGIANTLDDHGRYLAEYLNADLSKKFTLSDWEITPQVAAQTLSMENTRDNFLYPPGTVIPLETGDIRYFPNGLIGNPSFRERQYRALLNSRYVGFDQHRLLFGLGINQGRVYEVEESKNFDAQFNPLPALIKVKNDPALIWMPEKSRTNSYTLAQDEWQFASRWQLVTGVRFDHYSDFGNSTNPRLALIWDTSKQITTKLLYGSAFRAPSIQDLFAQANPKALGDANLKPEKMRTYELAFAYDPSSAHHAGLNLLHYKLNDFITDRGLNTGQIQRANDGERSGNGIEIEWDSRWSNQLRSILNMSSQYSVNDVTDDDIGNAPQQQLYARLEYRINPAWLFSPEWIVYGRQKREAGDIRPTVKGTGILNVNAVRVDQRGFEIQLAIKNLANKQYFTPLPVPDTLGYLSDIPAERRTGSLGLNYHF